VQQLVQLRRTPAGSSSGGGDGSIGSSGMSICKCFNCFCNSGLLLERVAAVLTVLQSVACIFKRSIPLLCSLFSTRLKFYAMLLRPCSCCLHHHVTN
jgi:hypothetical protein